MADKPQFETDDVSATRGRESGLGVGARELAAQRDPGDVQSRDDEQVRVEADEEDEAVVEREAAVVSPNEQLSRHSDA